MLFGISNKSTPRMMHIRYCEPLMYTELKHLLCERRVINYFIYFTIINLFSESKGKPKKK